MKKLLIAFLTVAMITTVVPGFDNEYSMITEVEAKANVKLSKTKLTLVKGKSATLKVIGSKKKIKWSTSNKKIAIVNSKGKVTGKKAGTCTITAKIGSKKYKCKVTVKNPIKLNKTKVTLNKGKTYTLKVTGTKKKVTWSSSNKKVAIVNSKGKVTAKKKGTATITAKADGLTVKSKVTVKNPIKSIAVDMLSLDITSVTLNKGNSYKMKVTVFPTDATNKTVTYISNNKSVVTVDKTGIVKAVGSGTATVTAKSNNGKTVKCKFTVKTSKIEVSSVTLNKSILSLNVGETQQLTATINPSNATNKNVEWQSNNTSVATVSSVGKVTARNVGTAYIYAISSNGVSKSCKITVNSSTSNEEQKDVETEVNSITLSSTSLKLNEYESTKLTANVTPSNAIDQKIKWVSSDSSVASVSSTGNVAAKKAGSATITASTSNNKTATCQVTVTKNQPKYKYDMEFLNEHGFYSGLDVIVHVKTNNPYPWYGTYDNFDTSKINVSVYSLDGERISGCSRAMSFADVHYIVNDTYNMHQCKVKDGFLISVSVDKAGTYEIRIEEDIPNSTGVTNPTYYNSNKKIQVCSKWITVLDYEQAEREWARNVIRERTNSLKNRENLEVMRDYIKTNFKYNNFSKQLVNTSCQTTPAWISKEVDCLGASKLMKVIAEELGYKSILFLTGFMDETLGGSGHRVALVDINEDGYVTKNKEITIDEFIKYQADEKSDIKLIYYIHKLDDIQGGEYYEASPDSKLFNPNEPFEYIDTNW